MMNGRGTDCSVADFTWRPGAVLVFATDGGFGLGALATAAIDGCFIPSVREDAAADSSGRTDSGPLPSRL